MEGIPVPKLSPSVEGGSREDVTFLEEENESFDSLRKRANQLSDKLKELTHTVELHDEETEYETDEETEYETDEETEYVTDKETDKKTEYETEYVTDKETENETENESKEKMTNKHSWMNKDEWKEFPWKETDDEKAQEMQRAAQEDMMREVLAFENKRQEQKDKKTDKNEEEDKEKKEYKSRVEDKLSSDTKGSLNHLTNPTSEKKEKFSSSQFLDLSLSGEKILRRSKGPYWQMPFRSNFFLDPVISTNNLIYKDPFNFAPTGDIYSYFVRRQLDPFHFTMPFSYQSRKALGGRFLN